MEKNGIEYSKSRTAGIRFVMTEKAFRWLVFLVVAIAGILVGADATGVLKMFKPG